MVNIILIHTKHTLTIYILDVHNSLLPAQTGNRHYLQNSQLHNIPQKSTKGIIKAYVVVAVAPALHVCKADEPKVSSNIYQLLLEIYCRVNKGLLKLGEGMATDYCDVVSRAEWQCGQWGYDWMKLTLILVEDQVVAAAESS